MEFQLVEESGRKDSLPSRETMAMMLRNLDTSSSTTSNMNKNNNNNNNNQPISSNNSNNQLVEVDEMDEEEEVPLADQTAELIGDGSQPYALPTLKVKHDRFKRIDAATLVKLIDGHFSETVGSFTIIDCRYPYEYHGGHIVNSLNIHTGADLVNFFLENKPNACRNNRHIIIFHCEFSSERGPRLMKLLREKDRQINKYPELIHPELYLLEGGYRDFFRKFKEYCVPQAYKPMKSRNHRDELRNYRKRRKASAPSRRKENHTPDISFEAS